MAIHFIGVGSWNKLWPKSFGVFFGEAQQQHTQLTSSCHVLGTTKSSLVVKGWW
jgi:hypothetical protein